jgi:hypothetical protein
MTPADDFRAVLLLLLHRLIARLAWAAQNNPDDGAP